MGTHADTLCEKGYALLEDGRLDEAQACLQEASKLAPDIPLIRYRLALAYADLGKPEMALTQLDVALELDPRDARAHNDRGSALQLLARLGEAENAFRRALELASDLAPPYVNLGNLYELQGRREKAVTIYQRAISRGLDAEMFGQRVAAVRGKTTTRSPDSWLRATFDNFASTFDAHLSALEYRVPEQLAGMLLPHIKDRADILDLGCGTGQCGVALSQCKRSLVGIDLSPKMLVEARAHGIYDALHEREVNEWLRRASAATFDVAIGADVFIYIGVLDDLFLDVARVLRDGGYFSFSTEEVETGDYTLLPTGRYAQSQDYVRRLAKANFAVVAAEPTVVRMNSGIPIPGRLYLLQKT